MLIPDLLSLKLLLILALIDLLKDILEPPVIRLQDRVLRRHVQRQALAQRQLEARVRKPADRLVRVVLRLGDAAAVLEVVDLDDFGLAAVGGAEHHLEDALAFDHFVLGAVLVAEGVAPDDDGLLPAGHQARDAGNDDGLAEDGAAEVVADGAVGGQPHLLEVELLDSCLVGGDSCALHADLVLLDGFGGVDGDLVVGFVAVLETQVVVLEVDVEVLVDELVLDVLPDDAGHFVAVELDERVLDLDLLDFGHFADGLVGG